MDEPLSAFVQRVWVARDHDERDDKVLVVQEIKRLEAELKRMWVAVAGGE